MEQKSPDKVCYQFICPRYPKCARLQGRGWISAVCGGAVGVSIFMTH